MEKVTLTKKESAELLGISIVTLSKWVSEGRLKAYRMSDKPKSPYLFTRKDCLTALEAVTAGPYKQDSLQQPKSEIASFPTRQNETSKKLQDLLKIRTKGRGAT